MVRAVIFGRRTTAAVSSLQSTILGAVLLQGRLKSLDQKTLPHWKNPFQTLHENDCGVTFRELAQHRDRWNDSGTARFLPLQQLERDGRG